MKECLELALLSTSFLIAFGFIGALILEFYEKHIKKDKEIEK